MKQNRSWRAVPLRILLVASFALALVIVHGVHAGNEPFHLVTDWSHRHMVYSAPKTLMDRFRFSTETRYVQQWVRRYAEERGDERDRDRWKWHHAEENPLHGDWSVYLGNVGSVGAGRYPAKYSFDTTVANCGTATQPDFVVWNTSLAGSGTAVAATDTGTFSATAGNGSTVTITNGANTLTMTAAAANAHTGGAGSGTGTFNRGASATASATGLATAIRIANNGSHVGVTATSAGAIVTITATTAGTAGNSITVAAQAASNLALTFANLVDGASGVASIVAYDNLYPTSCTGTVPSSYWAYDTGGTITNSVALSFDGKQVAFVQTVAGAAQLVMLKWATGSSVASPVTLTTQTTAANYRACTAPCMYSIALSGGLNDTNSAPYYDIDTDTIYVGDTPATRGTTNAFLHKFTGIFNGNPAEVVTAGVWPATLGIEITSSPVFDLNNNQVYIADANSGTPTQSGGYLYRVDSSAGTVVKSVELSRGIGFTDGPVVDAANGTVYLYSSDGGLLGCPGATTNNELFQMAANFAGGAGAVTSAQVSAAGTCAPTTAIYSGDFDNAYITGNAGHIYVCGNIGANPTLYQVNISAAGALGTVNAGPAVASAATTCSPVTEFENPNGAGVNMAREWIFLNVQASAVTAGPITCPAAAGCLMSFNVTNGPMITNATTTAARTAVASGASGVVVDTSATGTGEAEVYFTPLASGTCSTATNPGVGGCAIQATQSGLL